MWRVVMFLCRNEKHNRGAFLRGWSRLLSKLLDASQVAGLSRTVINCASESPLDGWPDDYDAVTEFWFEDAEQAAAMLRWWLKDDAIRSVVADWIKWDASPAWLGEVKPKLGLPGVDVKLLVAGYLADGWSESDAQLYWSDVHPVIAQGQTAFWTLLRRYVQIHGRLTPGVTGYMPMAAEIGAASFADLNRAFSHEQYLTTIRDDEAKFAKPQEMLAMASDREIVVYVQKRD